MAQCTRCDICQSTVAFTDASDVAQVPCNVRAFQTEVFTYWRCTACQSIHCLEDADLKRFYRDYPIKAHALDFWTRAAYANLLRRLAQAGLRPGNTVLDFGCGPGLLVRYLQERGFPHVSGYDPHVVEFADQATLARPHDMVIAQDVIEHAEDPRGFLADLVQLVTPGGLLSIGTPNAAGIDLTRPDLYSLSLHAPYHRHILSESALLDLGREFALAPVGRYHRFYYDTWWPTVNYRFLRAYVRRAGNVLDAAFEPPRVRLLFTSPGLWLDALFGYLFPPRSEMMVVFRRSAG